MQVTMGGSDAPVPGFERKESIVFIGDMGADFFVPFLVFSIPIIAIVGGITAGIFKTVSRHRLLELAQRERIAAIERGIDLSKLPPPPASIADSDDLGGMYLSPYEYSRRRSQNLMIGGVITLLVGIAISVFIGQVDRDDNGWAVGIIPAAVGVALLLCSWIVRPRASDRDMTPPGSPRQG
jgi:hypothetical protein